MIFIYKRLFSCITGEWEYLQVWPIIRYFKQHDIRAVDVCNGCATSYDGCFGLEDIATAQFKWQGGPQVMYWWSGPQGSVLLLEELAHYRCVQGFTYWPLPLYWRVDESLCALWWNLLSVTTSVVLSDTCLQPPFLRHISVFIIQLLDIWWCIWCRRRKRVNILCPHRAFLQAFNW